VVDFINHWEERGYPKLKLIDGLGLPRCKFYDWIQRYGKLNEHNGKLPRDYHVRPWEKEKIIAFYQQNQTEGYRRITYMMLDRDLVAVSPATTYRILSQAGVLDRWKTQKDQKKGKGFAQPAHPHRDWHTDVSYLNIGGTFYYFVSVLDGYSRAILHWDIRESMTTDDVAIVLQGAHELYPEAKPKIISDNGPQYIAREFKEYARTMGMRHVLISPYYPQSNGKIERFHKTLKNECLRVHTPVTKDQAKRVVGEYVRYYNEERLHSAIGYVTPLVKLRGDEKEVFKVRDARLASARERRRREWEEQERTVA
jgi:transposase InsO family protein